MDAMGAYLKEALNLMNQIAETQAESIKKAGELLAEAIIEERPIFVFGPGAHSFMGTEEMFYRSGGLIPIRPLLEPGVSMIYGARHATFVERTEGFAKAVLDSYQVKKGAVLIINNCYGINAVTIESALEAKRRGVTTIGVTSTAFCKSVPPGHVARHSSNKNLYEEVDVYIDTFVPPGDGMVRMEGIPQRVGPGSTMGMAFALNTLVCQTVAELVKRGHEPEIWMSANIPGGEEHNKKYLEKYREIKHLL